MTCTFWRPIVLACCLLIVPAARVRAEGAQSIPELQERLHQGTVFDVISLVYPNDRADFAYALSMQAATILAGLPEGRRSDTAKQEYGEILVRYGVKWPSPNEPPPTSAAEVTARTRLMFQGVDVIGLAQALKTLSGQYATQPLEREGFGKLENVKAEGDHATGIINGKSFDLTKTAEGRWFLRLPAP